MGGSFECDLLIIGGGIAGSALAREMSRYKLDTILVQENESLCDGASKTPTNPLYRGFGELNSIIVKTYMLGPGQTAYDLNWPRARQEKEGWDIWHQEWFKELDIPHKEIKSLYIATSKAHLDGLQRVKRLGRELGGLFAEMREVDRSFILAREPNINPDVIAGLWSDTHHRTIAYPWDIVIALLENARQNGVRVVRGARVTDISIKNERLDVETTQGVFNAGYVINAAGANADRIARMVGPIDWECVIDRLLTFILDEKAASDLVGGETYLALPAQPQYMQSLVPTLGGNLFCNCTRVEQTRNRKDTSVTREQLKRGLSIARQIIPAISETQIINSFCGAAARHTKDPENHIVEPHAAHSRFITVKLRPPAFPAIPTIARTDVPRILADAGLALTTKSAFNPFRKAIPTLRTLNPNKRQQLLKTNPTYGHVVCRCKSATEGEMVEAISRGARTLQDIKFMTGAGLGRCQGGFCTPHVLRILSDELGISPTEVLGREAPALFCETKELLRDIDTRTRRVLHDK